MSYDLSLYFKKLYDVEKATMEDLEKSRDRGLIVAKSSYSFFRDSENIKKMNSGGAIFDNEV
jgi:NAD-dependent DNA ligase